MAKGKKKFERLALLNRWRQKSRRRNPDWVIIGLQNWWASPHDYCFKICFFGIDLQIWFNVKYENGN